MYPKLEINLKKIRENISYVKKLCSESGVSITGVIKGCSGSEQVAQQFLEQGINSLGSSRIEQMKHIKSLEKSCETMLLRLPMLCEIEDVVSCCDISLNSERVVLEALNEASKRLGKKHQVILMYDLGDLREGVWLPDELVTLSNAVESMDGLHLLGIGANLSCYGSVKPTIKNMKRLISVTELVEVSIGRSLEIISGGATSTLPLIKDNKLPKRINHLRCGEGIILGKDLGEYYDCQIPLHTDTFLLKAQIIELKEKPSHPYGELVVDAFGNHPVYHDRGIRKRAILAIGKQDFGSHEKLISVDNRVLIIGSSSDHLIVDVTEASDYQVGDIISFTMYYQPMLYLSLSNDVYKSFVL
ncbi:MAG: alanine/ornithine racemase family PLP-dependent enzyme [Clostridiales bacterium]|nr:alanine/ornithine racemase family PLP-dependent enzyme [Clostridiales bacterium]